jgi:hypothetical protein
MRSAGLFDLRQRDALSSRSSPVIRDGKIYRAILSDRKFKARRVVDDREGRFDRRIVDCARGIDRVVAGRAAVGRRLVQAASCRDANSQFTSLSSHAWT